MRVLDVNIWDATHVVLIRECLRAVRHSGLTVQLRVSILLVDRLVCVIQEGLPVAKQTIRGLAIDG